MTSNVHPAIAWLESFVKFQHLSENTAHELTGTVVVMDVLRAFTTAAFAFDAGAEKIVMVDDVDRAFALRQANPDWVLMGEVGGVPINGFDYSNSPAEVSCSDLHGRTVVQRTSAGTQGVARARNAQQLLCGSLVCAPAIAAILQGFSQVSYLITEGDEDMAGAEFIEALRASGMADTAGACQRVRESDAGRQLLTDRAIGVPADVELATDVGRFDFAIKAQHSVVGVIAQKVYPKRGGVIPKS